MVMPNIGAFIAWGFITAIFIKEGWINLALGGTLPNDSWVAQIGGWGVDAASCAQEILDPTSGHPRPCLTVSKPVRPTAAWSAR